MKQRPPGTLPPSIAAHAARRLAGWASVVTSLAVLGLGAAQANGPADALPHRSVTAGQAQFELPSIYLLLPDDMRRTGNSLTPARETGAAAAPDTPRFIATGSGSSPRARLVEMPADVIPGQYARPKYALGFRSHGMKKFAHSIGLDAHTCLAPLVRARVNFSQDGDAGGRLMLFARCSLR